MNLQISQLLALASGAGFSGDDVALAVAIALAESSGNPQAYNPERAAGAAEGYGSFGLWQIYLEKHPEFGGQNLFDPQVNAAAAYAVYASAGNSFRPWSTFGSGAYRKQLDAVNQALTATSPDATASDSGPGFTPSNTDLITLLVAGGLAIWGLARFAGW
jgi:Lysozyme like domain